MLEDRQAQCPYIPELQVPTVQCGEFPSSQTLAKQYFQLDRKQMAPHLNLYLDEDLLASHQACPHSDKDPRSRGKGGSI